MEKKQINKPIETVTNQPAPRGCLILLFFFFVIIVLLITAGIFLLRNPNQLFRKLLQKANLPFIANSSVIKIKPPKLLSDQKVTQKIPVTGGSAKVTTDTGYTYTVTIGPGVLKEESTLTLTPLEEEPYDLPSSDEPAPDPGIDITVDPPLNPPAPPDEPPVNPDDPTDHPPTPPPIDVEVTFVPSEMEPGTVVPDTSQYPNEMARRIMESAGLGNLSPTVTPKPVARTRGDRTEKTPTFFVFVPRQGPARILPIGPIGGNPPDKTPPDEGEPPTGGNGDVPGEGTITPEDPEDEGKGDDAANQAAANGHCTDEYIFAFTQAYNNAKATGDTKGMNSYGGALKNCAKDKLSYLKRLCQTDRRLLRRLDFNNYKKSLGGVPDASPMMIDAIKLENECKGYYSISGSASPAGFGGDVVIASTIDSHVCGYFDDLWQGTDTYNLTAEGGAGVHNYEAVHKFRLPPRGGTFGATDTPTSQGLYIIGRGVDFTIPHLGFYGTFDGVFFVDIILYPMANLKTEIPLISTDCTEENQPEPPLAPLPNDSSNNQMPLEDLNPKTPSSYDNTGL